MIRVHFVDGTARTFDIYYETIQSALLRNPTPAWVNVADVGLCLNMANVTHIERIDDDGSA